MFITNFFNKVYRVPLEKPKIFFLQHNSRIMSDQEEPPSESENLWKFFRARSQQSDSKLKFNLFLSHPKIN
jgi:hypothetical protein